MGEKAVSGVGGRTVSDDEQQQKKPGHDDEMPTARRVVNQATPMVLSAVAIATRNGQRPA
jgi:hypothetical protein